MRIDVVTIFPGYLAPLREALPGRAIEGGLVELAVHDLRSWTHDVHQAVDDAPYGGGPGMVMRPQVWGEALDATLTATCGADARLAYVMGRTRCGHSYWLSCLIPTGMMPAWPDSRFAPTALPARPSTARVFGSAITFTSLA